MELHYQERVVRCYDNRPRSVDELLRQAAADAPTSEAVVDGPRRCNYVELDAAADAIALGLLARGVRPGERVALLLANRIEFVECLFGIIRMGAVAVPLNVREQRFELRSVLQHAEATVLIHEADLRDRLPSIDEVPSLIHRFAVGGSCAGSEPLDSLYALNGKPVAPLSEDETAVIVYTSGTTGRPKGAMLTHLSLVTSAMNYESCWGLDGRDRSIMTGPANNVTGLVANILTMVRACGATIMMREFKATRFLELAATERMTYALLVPTMYHLCLLQGNFSDYDLSRWRVGAYGGALMPVRTIERLATALPHVQLLNVYGSTETTSPATLSPLGTGRLRPDTVGRPVPSAEIIVVDERGIEVTNGKSGEVWIAGANVAVGYWKDAEATRSAFVGGYWRSGDIGTFTADGYLKILDRSKDLINRGGYKVHSTELEQVLMQHTAVIEAAVIPASDPVLGEKTHAVVQVGGRSVSAVELKSFCADRLSDYKVPDFVTFVHQPLPRSNNGKILKRGLGDWVRSLAQSGEAR
ncbi:MAG TPA: class I adenylate-forming enzyme family protein [Steroidobacteraceae bacterium]|nr:class I adenylate-forming enzyme family protein [Steroidobacteraceae bacterium]